jgi:uncharacterized membrane protein YeaQ/YmgE (transglycosylase-associated protein family)
LLTRSHAEYVEGDTLIDMIKEDLVAERIAIDSYREMAHYLGQDDSTSRRLMEEILAVEEEHADDLVTLLQELGPEQDKHWTLNSTIFHWRKDANMLGWIGWIIFGLVVGIVGKFLMPGRDPGGFIVTILLGIAGALLGGFIGRALGLYNEGEPAGFIMAVIGAIILLAIYRAVIGRRRTV